MRSGSGYALSPFTFALMLGSLLTVTALTHAGVAWSNTAAANPNPSTLSAPRFAGATTLKVTDEKLVFRCTEQGDAIECHFSADYRLTHPGTSREDLVGAFYSVRSRGVQVTLDGSAAITHLTALERNMLEEAITKADRPYGDSPGSTGAEKVARTEFRLSAEPGSTHSLVATGIITSERQFSPAGYSLSAVRSRHLAFAKDVDERRGHNIDYLIYPIRTWAEAPGIRVEVEYPTQWSLTVNGDRWEETTRGATRTTSGTVLPSKRGLRLAFSRHVGPAVSGGPLLAFGGAWGDQGGFRTRAGYEIARPSWLLYSASVDTDWRRRVVMTVLTKAATPFLVLLPSMGLGLGVPVQLAPSVRPALRLEADAHFLPAGIVVSVDIYPKVGRDASFTVVSLLGQISL